MVLLFSSKEMRCVLPRSSRHPSGISWTAMPALRFRKVPGCTYLFLAGCIGMGHRFGLSIVAWLTHPVSWDVELGIWARLLALPRSKSVRYCLSQVLRVHLNRLQVPRWSAAARTLCPVIILSPFASRRSRFWFFPSVVRQASARTP